MGHERSCSYPEKKKVGLFLHHVPIPSAGSSEAASGFLGPRPHHLISHVWFISSPPGVGSGVKHFLSGDATSTASRLTRDRGRRLGGGGATGRRGRLFGCCGRRPEDAVLASSPPGFLLDRMTRPFLKINMRHEAYKMDRKYH